MLTDVLIGVAAWCVVSVPVGIIVGRRLRGRRQTIDLTVATPDLQVVQDKKRDAV